MGQAHGVTGGPHARTTAPRTPEKPTLREESRGGPAPRSSRSRQVVQAECQSGQGVVQAVHLSPYPYTHRKEKREGVRMDLDRVDHP